MINEVKIALAQAKVINGDPAANMQTADLLIDKAAKENADIIVFPELFYCGYDVSKEDLRRLAEPSDGCMFRHLRSLAIDLGIHIAMGYPEIDKNSNDLYVSLMMIDDSGNLIHNHRKSYVWTADLDRVTPGTDFEVFETKFGKVGLLICYEMEFPEPARILTLKGARLILVSSAFSDVDLMEKNLSAIAVQNLIYVAGVNNISMTYKGRSMFVDQYGTVIAKASSKEDELLIHTIDLSRDRRQSYPAFHDYENSFVDNTLKLYNEATRSFMENRNR